MTDAENTRPPFHTTTPGPVGPSAEPSGPLTEVSTAKWTAIEADLAQRGVTGEPTLVTAERVTWSDGALGCPKPGQAYTQALIDGTRVVVTVDGTPYDYRFGDGDTPVLCER